MVNQSSYFRQITIFILFFILLWKVILWFFAPELTAFGTIKSILLITSLILLYVFSYRIEWIRKNLKQILYVIIILWTAAAAIEAAIHPFNRIYLLRPLVSLPIVSVIFLDRKWLNGYLLFNFIVTAVSTLFMDIPIEFEALFIFGYVSILLSVAVLLNITVLLYNRYKIVIRELAMKNEQIEAYANLNAHHVRAPLARLMGLINLFGLDVPYNELTDKVKHEAHELDKIIRSAQEILA